MAKVCIDILSGLDEPFDNFFTLHLWALLGIIFAETMMRVAMNENVGEDRN